MSLLEERMIYRPMKYPWAFEAWLAQERIHWLHEEIPMAEDVKDWNTKLSDSEKNLLIQIFRFFTQADVEVNNCYVQHYFSVFKPTEIKMMLTAFANMETIHIAAYAHLLDTLGLPEEEYSAFLEYGAMKKKYDYMHGFSIETKVGIARTLAAFGAFTEGLQLFASFAILLNFPRFNKMKGMGQIVTWSVRDESLHVESIIKLFHVFCQENPEIISKEFMDGLYKIADDIVSHEDLFIDLAFEMGDVEGLKASEVKQYIRYIADRRLNQLGLKKIYKVDNPLTWLDEMLNGMEFANFFENRVTEYSKGSTSGDWSEAF